MGIFKNIGKIEELIEANVPGSWCIYHNALTVKDLPENYKNAMLQFGYTENAPIFGVDWTNTDENNKQYALVCVGYGKEVDKLGYKNLLYRDVDRNWRFSWTVDDCKSDLNIFKEKLDFCYRRLQEYFMFMKIYLREREQMVKLINIAYDEVIEKTDSL
jgi:hypothetical protein